MRGVAQALVLWLGLSGAAQAGDAFEVLSGFADRIYAAGETDGGSPETWDLMERNALDRLRDARGSLTAANGDGRTPLMVAAANGYGFAVAWLLTDAGVRDTLNARDRDGLSARDLAQMAMRQTAQACAPKIDNPFILVSLLVTLPYYIDRQPYPEILHALDQAGAEAGDDALRAHWLRLCPEAEPGLRARIAGTAPVQRSLMEGAHQVMIAKCSAEARLRHRGIARMFGGRADAVGVIAQSRGQLADRVAECTADLAGFLPD